MAASTNAPIHAQAPNGPEADLTVILMLARLLDRLDASAAPVDAFQYRSVVQHLAGELQKLQHGPVMQALLDAHPAAAEMYENFHYRHAGLCRSPLDRSLAAEMAARDAIARAAHIPRQQPHG